MFFSIAFVCVKVFLKFNPSISARNQSIIWLGSLYIPVFVSLFFHPQTMIAMSFSPPQNPISLPATTSTSAIFWWPTPSVLSITGLLCLSGVIGAAGYLTVAILFGKKIVMKDLYVFGSATVKCFQCGGQDLPCSCVEYRAEDGHMETVETVLCKKCLNEFLRGINAVSLSRRT